LGGFVWWKSGAGESAATLAASEPAVAPVTETAQAPTPFTSHTAPPPADLNSATQGQPQQVQKPLIEAAPDPLPELPPAIEAPPESSEKESPSQDSSSPPSKPANDKPEETEPEQASEERSIPQLIDPLGINPADLDL